jgi:hypothetical protein
LVQALLLRNRKHTGREASVVDLDLKVEVGETHQVFRFRVMLVTPVAISLSTET